MTAYYVIAFFVLALSLPFFHYSTLQIYQQSAYRLGEAFTSISRIPARRYLLSAVTVLTLFALSVLFNAFLSMPLCFTVLIPLSVVCFSLGLFRHRRAKIRLKLTARLKRFAVVFAVISSAVSTSFAVVFLPLMALSLPLSGAVGLTAAHLLTARHEKRKNARFIRSATEKLAAHGAIKIGITGSYGKTTAKSILTELLSQVYPTCATRGNHNTPLGVALTVNNDLLCDDKIFVAEMGARRVGDIAELCDIVKPSVTVVTSVGAQHLDTFKTRENIIKTKGEIIDGTAEGGFSVLNADSEGCRLLKSRGYAKKYFTGRDEAAVEKLLDGKAYETELAAFYGRVSVSENGTCFVLVLDGHPCEIHTPLIAPYAPSAITQCAFVAKMLGIPAEKIKFAAKNLKPVAHRLQLLYNGSDLIIDDAYNGSVESITAALDTLARLSEKTKVVVTPGVVELGKEQYSANYALGELAARKSDYAVFVGVNAKPLSAGALGGGMANERVFAVDSLRAATEILKQIKGERVILFANDLPDGY